MSGLFLNVKGKAHEIEFGLRGGPTVKLRGKKVSLSKLPQIVKTENPHIFDPFTGKIINPTLKQIRARPLNQSTMPVIVTSKYSEVVRVLNQKLKDKMQQAKDLLTEIKTIEDQIETLKVTNSEQK